MPPHSLDKDYRRQELYFFLAKLRVFLLYWAIELPPKPLLMLNFFLLFAFKLPDLPDIKLKGIVFLSATKLWTMPWRFLLDTGPFFLQLCNSLNKFIVSVEFIRRFLGGLDTTTNQTALCEDFLAQVICEQEGLLTVICCSNRLLFLRVDVLRNGVVIIIIFRLPLHV